MSSLNRPNLYNCRTATPSRRQAAYALYFAGKNIDEVMAELGLKRSTAGVYLFEARAIAKDNKYRERAIALFLEGRTISVVAHELGIPEKDVTNYRHEAQRKARDQSYSAPLPIKRAQPIAQPASPEDNVVKQFAAEQDELLK